MSAEKTNKDQQLFTTNHYQLIAVLESFIKQRQIQNKFLTIEDEKMMLDILYHFWLDSISSEQVDNLIEKMISLGWNPFYWISIDNN